MAISRRLFFVGGTASVVSACFSAGSPAPTPAASATPTPTPTPTPTSTGEVPGWAQFKRSFLDATGRVVDTGNRGISHSEGQGYGMVMAFFSDDRPAFESLWNWTRTTLARPDGLHIWRYDPAAADPVADRNNATDGDVLIAWALGLAGRTWNVPEWTAQAAHIRQAMLRVNAVTFGNRRVLLPGETGFAMADKVVLNPAYYVWPALDAFARLAPAEGWGDIITGGTQLLTDARFGAHQLPPDWVDVAADGRLAPASGRDPRFGYDAVRVPLYAHLGGRSGLARPAVEYWAGKIAANQPAPAWVDVTSGAEAEYAGAEGVQAIVALTTGRGTGPAALSSDYYSAVLQLLARLDPARFT